MSSKILLIGPLTNKKNPKLIGGAIVLFQNLLDELEEQQRPYLLIDSNKQNYKNIFIAYISIFMQIFSKQFLVKHISLHSSRDYFILMPFILVCGKLFNRSTSLRKFGGEAWETLNQSKGLKYRLLLYIFKNVDFLFLEMKFLVNNFLKLNQNSFWFPNVRNRPNMVKEKRNFSKRFVFISHIKKEKGVDEIVEVVSLLDKNYTIDLYGIINDNRYSEDYFKKKGISYKGALDANRVLKTLSSYDVLLLPSYQEGYPGIVIESYSLGIPVITTNLIGLREIVDNYKTGITIPIKNILELKSAIEYFNFENYNQMSQYAQKKFLLFNTQDRTKKFLDIILKKDK